MALSIFAVKYEFGDPKGTVREVHRSAHRRFLDEQLNAGRLLLAGPVADPPTGALLLLAADSCNEALAIAEQDPYVQAGAVERMTADQLRVTRLDPEALASYLPPAIDGH